MIDDDDGHATDRVTDRQGKGEETITTVTRTALSGTRRDETRQDKTDKTDKKDMGFGSRYLSLLDSSVRTDTASDYTTA